MFLDHRPSFVSFKKGLYLTRSSICLRAAALGQTVPWESFLALVAFLLVEGSLIPNLKVRVSVKQIAPLPRPCHKARRVADALGIELTIINAAKNFLEVLQKPAHGYGANMTGEDAGHCWPFQEAADGSC
jgi:hypothetical protein